MSRHLGVDESFKTNKCNLPFVQTKVKFQKFILLDAEKPLTKLTLLLDRSPGEFRGARDIPPNKRCNSQKGYSPHQTKWKEFKASLTK